MIFLLAAHTMPLDLPAGISATHFKLIAPYNPDPRRWESMTWTDYYSGNRFAISTVTDSGSGVARVKSLADVFEEYRHHPEPKSVGPDGEPCGRPTSGALGRRPVLGMFPIYVGKESISYEEVEQGRILDCDQVDPSTTTQGRTVADDRRASTEDNEMHRYREPFGHQ